MSPQRAQPDQIAISGAVAAAADRLRIDAATVEISQAFRAAGLLSLLLKGPSITTWLYSKEDQPLPYLDCDLLVRPGDWTVAEEVLMRLGFGRRLDERQLPAWWREHAGEWWRDSDGVVVDLHRSLPGVKLDAASAWNLLAARPASIPVAGCDVAALAPPARALNLSLHAAHHGGEQPKSLVSLERGLSVLGFELWEQAAALAEELLALDAFAAGLRLTPAGELLAERLALPAVGSVEVALRATTPPPGALGFDQLARAPGLIARVGIGFRKLIPPAAFMRHWYPPAAESRAALLLAYVRRPFWILGNAPRGLRAWWRVRRAVRKRARR